MKSTDPKKVNARIAAGRSVRTRKVVSQQVAIALSYCNRPLAQAQTLTHGNSRRAWKLPSDRSY
jgi:hypothetical protein